MRSDANIEVVVIYRIQLNCRACNCSGNLITSTYPKALQDTSHLIRITGQVLSSHCRLFAKVLLLLYLITHLLMGNDRGVFKSALDSVQI